MAKGRIHLRGWDGKVMQMPKSFQKHPRVGKMLRTDLVLKHIVYDKGPQTGPPLVN